MLHRKINRGTPPPLFERIVNEKGQRSGTLLDAQQLQDSIIAELSTILSTRCTVRKVIYQDHIQTIPFFGFPDFFGLSDLSQFDGSNPQEWPMIALSLQTTIQAAEPRLKHIQVKLEHYNPVEQVLSIRVSAVLETPYLLKEIHFPLEVQYRFSSLQGEKDRAVA